MNSERFILFGKDKLYLVGMNQIKNIVFLIWIIIMTGERYGIHSIESR